MLISAFECPIINSVENYGGSSSSGGNEPEAEMATTESASWNQYEPVENEKKKKNDVVLVAFHAFVCPDIKLPDNLSECKCGIVTEFDWKNLQPLELIK